MFRWTRRGEIDWKSGIFQKPGRPDAHVIEILTEEALFAYRAYLRKKGISYIIAGEQQGVVDELSLLLAPAADGDPTAPTVFEKSEFLAATAPVEFQLKNIEELRDSGIRFGYSRNEIYDILMECM